MPMLSPVLQAEFPMRLIALTLLLCACEPGTTRTPADATMAPDDAQAAVMRGVCSESGKETNEPCDSAADCITDGLTHNGFPMQRDCINAELGNVIGMCFGANGSQGGGCLSSGECPPGLDCYRPKCTLADGCTPESERWD